MFIHHFPKLIRRKLCEAPASIERSPLRQFSLSVLFVSLISKTRRTFKRPATESAKAFWRNDDGNIAIAFALTGMLLLVGVGVAVDYSQKIKLHTEAQDIVDAAALSAAKYMRDQLSSKKAYSQSEARKGATELGEATIQTQIKPGTFSEVRTKFVFSDTDVTVRSTLSHQPFIMQVFGYKALENHVSATASIESGKRHNLDLILIADATASMSATLTGIQSNMKRFTFDLDKELAARNVVLGDTRVKFIFFRDYMMDNHSDWTGRRMDPPMPRDGPMYESKFFELPAERVAMENYVDVHEASQGGSIQESGLEALNFAITSTEWRSPEDTVRSIVLWTDAPARLMGDRSEEALAEGYYSDAFWEKKLGAVFAGWPQRTREAFIYLTRYPFYEMPYTMEQFEQRFAGFHEPNSKGREGTKSLYVNVFQNCQYISPCPGWETDIKNWDGVRFILEPKRVSSTETYEKIIEQVADIVISQTVTTELALTQ